MRTEPSAATSTVPDANALATRTVAILCGGRSSERAVSLRTADCVQGALAAPADPVDARGPRRVLRVEIGADGRWRHPEWPTPLAPGAAVEALADVHVFFLALHGGEGEDGTVQGFLDLCDRAYTGTGVKGSAVAMDKVLARSLAQAAGLCIASGRLVGRERFERAPADERAAVAALAHGAGVPATDADGAGWFVKPRSGGSSVGMSWVRALADLDAALERAFAEEDDVLVERAIAGLELTVGVVERAPGVPYALTPVEIRPHAGRFFDYDEKYAEGGALELCPPESVSAAVQADLRDRAVLAHRVLGCEGFSRTDFILPAAGGPPVFLETNTLPGLTDRSLLPQEAAAEGMDYRSLCLWIAADGLARGARRATRS